MGSNTSIWISFFAKKFVCQDFVYTIDTWRNSKWIRLQVCFFLILFPKQSLTFQRPRGLTCYWNKDLYITPSQSEGNGIQTQVWQPWDDQSAVFPQLRLYLELKLAPGIFSMLKWGACLADSWMFASCWSGIRLWVRPIVRCSTTAMPLASGNVVVVIVGWMLLLLLFVYQRDVWIYVF